jgi:glucosamine 6-phosphate synthetase-like amidotransferase/phosphosugar isomerase protein
MCCLFGLLDYNNIFSSKEKNLILSVLSTECEARGVDATGIAYNIKDKLCIYKKALPAHKLRYAVPSNVHYIMGHTRMATQGSEKRNYNNHPFISKSGKFSLCHNGILHNDIILRKNEALPSTQIQTDSYIAVQLIDKQKVLNFESLKLMAEKVEGSFTFTVLDNKDSLYIVRGNNPFCLYHYSTLGFYLYASTEEILIMAVNKLGIQDWHKEDIKLSCGDILKIDRHGKMNRKNFDSFDLCWEIDFRNCANNLGSKNPASFNVNANQDFIQELKSVAYYFGYSPDCIDEMLAEGFTIREIEEMLYEPNNQDYRV